MEKPPISGVSMAVTVGFEPTGTSKNADVSQVVDAAADSPTSTGDAAGRGFLTLAGTCRDTPAVRSSMRAPRCSPHPGLLQHAVLAVQLHLAPARRSGEIPLDVQSTASFRPRPDSLCLEHDRLTGSMSRRPLQLRRQLKTPGKTGENGSEWIGTNCARCT